MIKDVIIHENRDKYAMRVTFDTNTLDRVARPERFPKDPYQPNYLKVHQAIVDGRIQGFFSETIICLEGIQKNDRAAVLGSTTINTREDAASINEQTGLESIRVTFTMEEPGRKPLHPEAVARIRTAHGNGMRLLRAPRLQPFLINDPNKTVFALKPDDATTAWPPISAMAWIISARTIMAKVLARRLSLTPRIAPG